MSGERHHFGEDAEDVTHADLAREDAEAHDRADAVLEAASAPAKENTVASPDEIEARLSDPDRDRLGTRLCRWCGEFLADQPEEVAHSCEGRENSRLYQPPETSALLEPATHEFGAYLVFAGHGLSPYFAMISEWDQALGEFEENVDSDADAAIIAGSDDIGEFDAAGSTWALNHDENKMKAWDGKIAARDGDAVDGGLRECQIGLVATDDPIGERTVTFSFRPRYPNATHCETGEPIQSIPDDVPEAVSVRVDSSNLQPRQTLDVLQALADQMGIRPRYFSEASLHHYSRVFTYARYVRILRAISEARVVGKDRLIDALADFASGVKGSRGKYRWDHEEVMGHYVALATDPTALHKVTSEHHRVGKNLKSYHMANPEASAGSVTYHPKLEVQYSNDFSKVTPCWMPAPDQDAAAEEVAADFTLDELREEIDQYLLSALAEAGLPVTPDGDVFVEDDYWDATAREREFEVERWDLDSLRQAEETIARTEMARPDVPSAHRQVIQLLADGGPQHYEDLAEASDTSKSTVYRAAGTFSNIVRVVNGIVDFEDDVVRSQVKDVLAGLEDRLRWAESGIDAIADDARDTLLQEGSSLAKWARAHGVTPQENRDQTILRLSGRYSRSEVIEVLRNGYQAAYRDGADEASRLLEVAVKWTDEDGESQNAINPFTTWSNRTVKALGVKAGVIP